MELAKYSSALGLAILAALATPSARADEWGQGGYIGGDFGRSRAHIDDQRIANILLLPPIVTTSLRTNDRDYGWKLFGGYSFNRNFAIEAGYFNLGKFSYDATTLPAGTFSGSSKFQGVNLDLVGTIPFGEHFAVFGRVGATYGETRSKIAGGGAVHVFGPSDWHSRGGNWKYGAGLEYDFDPSWGLRAEAERYRVDDALNDRAHIDVFSLGLVFRFGHEVAVVERPAPVYAPPPQPAPAPVVDCSTQDDDHDGVNNCNDRCPDSPAGQGVGADGCPVPPPVAEPPKPFRG